jgi:ABC-type Mn2+/Zn2+ transport system ATPase subunit
LHNSADSYQIKYSSSSQWTLSCIGLKLVLSGGKKAFSRKRDVLLLIGPNGAGKTAFLYQVLLNQK